MIKSYINATWSEYVDEEASIEHTLEGVYVASNRDLGLPELEVEHQQPMTSFAGVKGFYYQFESEEQMLELVPELQPVEVEEMPEQVEQEPAPYDLEAGKATAKAMLDAAYNKLQAQATADYPSREPLTWPTKLEEALRYVNTGESNYIEGIASKLGIEPEAFAQKVLANNEAYQAVIIDLEAFRMLTDDAIESAETKQDIEQIMGGIHAKSN